MKFQQKVIIKIVDFEVEHDDIETYEGFIEACENDTLDSAEQGFMLGYISS